MNVYNSLLFGFSLAAGIILLYTYWAYAHYRYSNFRLSEKAYAELIKEFDFMKQIPVVDRVKLSGNKKSLTVYINLLEGSNYTKKLTRTYDVADHEDSCEVDLLAEKQTPCLVV